MPEMDLKELVVTIRDYNGYSVMRSKELSDLMGKPYWVSNENYCYFVKTKYSNGWVLVPRGYGTDGASVPSMAQSIVSVWGPHGAQVILHDWLCEYGYLWVMDEATKKVSKKYITRKEVDNIFFEALTVGDVPESDLFKIRVAVNAHRFFTRPKIPNVNLDKARFEMNYRAHRGWALADGSKLYDYLGRQPEVFV